MQNEGQLEMNDMLHKTRSLKTGSSWVLLMRISDRFKEIMKITLLVTMFICVFELVYTAFVAVRQIGYKSWQEEMAIVKGHRRTVDSGGHLSYEVELEYKVYGKTYVSSVKCPDSIKIWNNGMKILINPNEPKQSIPKSAIKDPMEMLKGIPAEVLFISLEAAFIIILRESISMIIDRFYTKKERRE